MVGVNYLGRRPIDSRIRPGGPSMRATFGQVSVGANNVLTSSEHHDIPASGAKARRLAQPGAVPFMQGLFALVTTRLWCSQNCV